MILILPKQPVFSLPLCHLMLLPKYSSPFLNYTLPPKDSLHPCLPWRACEQVTVSTFPAS